MCGVHPDAEFIVRGIGSRLVNGKEWKSFLKDVKDCKLTIERYRFNPKKPLIGIRKDFERILAGLMKKRNPEHRNFMGFYIFPDDGRLHLSEVSLLNLIGSMAGDIVIEKTGLVATSWYAPRSWNSAASTRPFNFKLPNINIMLIEWKQQHCEKCGSELSGEDNEDICESCMDEEEERFCKGVPVKKRLGHAKRIFRK